MPRPTSIATTGSRNGYGLAAGEAFGDFEGLTDGTGSFVGDGPVEGWIGNDRVGTGVGVGVCVGVAVGVGVAAGLGDAPMLAAGGKGLIGSPASAASMNVFHNVAGIEPPVTSLRPRIPCNGLLLSRNSATAADICGV